MSMTEALYAMARKSNPLFSDGTVTFTILGSIFTATDVGGEVDLVLDDDYFIGDDLITLVNSNGGGFSGSILEGSAVTIDGETYTANKDARVRRSQIELLIDTPLISDVSVGDPVDSSDTQVSISASKRAVTSQVRESLNSIGNVTFGVQFASLLIKNKPRVGWIAEWVGDHDDNNDSGTVISSLDSSGGIIVWIGVGARLQGERT